MPIRILIADDHAVFRSGLRALLEKEADMRVIGESGDGLSAVEAVCEMEVGVLLLDITMPGLTGPEVAKIVRKERPDTAVVMLTSHEDEYYVNELMGIGASAYVLKKSTKTALLLAIRAAHDGEKYVDPSLAGQMISSRVGRQSPKNGPAGQASLTPREQEVCTLLAYGHTNAEIAKKLFISERTVETHRTNLMAKLDIKSRAQLVHFAIDHGLLKLA